MGCQFYVNICFKDEMMSFHFDVSISWNNLNNKSVVLGGGGGGGGGGVFTTQTLSMISVFYVDGIAHCFLILTACLLLLRSQIYCSWFDCKPQVNVRCIFSVTFFGLFWFLFFYVCFELEYKPLFLLSLLSSRCTKKIIHAKPRKTFYGIYS